MLATFVLASACSRSVPDTWSTESPASADAEPLPSADVTLALDGDPPLPGEPTGGWIGLDQPEPAEDPHAKHRGHGGHAGHEMPAKPKPAKPTGHEGHDGH